MNWFFVSLNMQARPNVCCCLLLRLISEHSVWQYIRVCYSNYWPISGCKRKIELTNSNVDVTNGDIELIRQEFGSLTGKEILEKILEKRSDKKLSFDDSDVRAIIRAVSHETWKSFELFHLYTRCSIYFLILVSF